ncbi:MAG: hypothetical protein WC108_07600 [Bacteroidales bacterium]|jgi:hypothetical protein
MKAKVNFYGVVCIAKFTETSFELEGRNKFTTNLLNIYGVIILRLLELNSFLLAFFNIPNKTEFKIKVLEEIKDDREVKP